MTYDVTVRKGNLDVIKGNLTIDDSEMEGPSPGECKGSIFKRNLQFKWVANRCIENHRYYVAQT